MERNNGSEKAGRFNLSTSRRQPVSMKVIPITCQRSCTAWTWQLTARRARHPAIAADDRRCFLRPSCHRLVGSEWAQSLFSFGLVTGRLDQHCTVGLACVPSQPEVYLLLVESSLFLENPEKKYVLGFVFVVSGNRVSNRFQSARSFCAMDA
jgi:hypothetical protein